MERLNVVRMVILPKLKYRFNGIPITVSTALFKKMDR